MRSETLGDNSYKIDCMSISVSGFSDLDYNGLYAIPLGGQSELGLVIWLFIHQGQILIVDAGASYPAGRLPCVDLILPNTTFLETNESHILAQVVTNGHEEHLGALTYLLQHVKLPQILCPRFVGALIDQNIFDLYGTGKAGKPPVEICDLKKEYKVGPFVIEFIESNNSIADACALRISCQAGTVLYTSSFKIDQTPVDGGMLDVGRLSQIGDEGVSLLVSCSTNVEGEGYSASEKVVAKTIEKVSLSSKGRLIVVMPGTNTHRLQVLFDVAAKTKRKVYLVGESLHKVAVSAAISGHLTYDRSIEGDVSALDNASDRDVLVITSSKEADPINVLEALAEGEHDVISLKSGDALIFSSDVVPGQARRMALILDNLLIQAVNINWGAKQKVHVSRYGAKEELKLMLSIAKPRYFAPAIGEARHIAQHGDLGVYFNLDEKSVFNLQNGDILEIKNGMARTVGQIESSAVMFNREQGERVTTASVKERQALSLEGVLTVALTLDSQGIVSGPSIECGAAGFLLTNDWIKVQEDLKSTVLDTVVRIAGERQGDERDSGPYLRSAIREAVVKVLRNKLSAKPTVQVLVHQI